MSEVHAQAGLQQAGPQQVEASARRFLRFDRLTLADGLSQGHIYDIFQDRRGFLWFATESGLNRYDGYTFKVYAPVPFDSTSLADGSVNDVYEDRAGRLWIATQFGGLSRLDPFTETFTAFQHDPADPHSLRAGPVHAVFEDRAGALWVGTEEGLDRMTPDQPGHFTHFRHDPDDPASLSDDEVRSIAEDEAGALWIATANGLNRMAREAPGRFTRYLHDAGAPSPGHSLHRQYAPPNAPGVRWIGSDDGLIRFDAADGRAERFFPNPRRRPGENVVHTVSPDPAAPGVLWVPTLHGGVARFDPAKAATGAFAHYRSGPDDSHGLVEHAGSFVYTDRAGMVWVGSSGGGLNTFDPTTIGVAHYGAATAEAPGLRNPNIWGLTATRDGAIWAGTDEFYLHRIDPATGAVRVWQADPDAPPDPARPVGEANAFAENPDGTLWVGTTHGLDRYDPATDRFTHYRHDPADPASLSNDDVMALYRDRAGALWVGTGDGLNRFDAASGAFTRYRHDPSDPTSLGSDWVGAMLEDHAGRLWVTIEDGVGRLDRTTGRFRNYRHDPRDPATLTNGRFGSLHERAREPGVLWMGSLDGGGLDRLDTRTGAVTHFTSGTSELPDNTVYAILEDEAGRLWLSTNYGLARFDPDEPSPRRAFRRFGLESGLQGLEFNQHAAARGADGRFHFGGIHGLNAFQPRDLEGNATAPFVALTDVRVSNESLFAGGAAGGAALRKALAETGELRLGHDQRNVTFAFVGLHFKNPASNRYRYRLDGFDADWVEAGTQRMAGYTNLAPGAYTFRVTAANSDGVWNETPGTLRLTILPPWWKTPWAYAAYVLFFAVAVFAVDRVQRRRLLRRERARSLLREKELRAEATEARANYFQAENERQTQELEQARALQLSLLPAQMPRHRHALVAARMQTAAEVGGDYYDFHVGEDDTLTLAIGDATGHGTKAGVVVTATKSLFTNYADEPDPVRVLRKASQALRRMKLSKMFMAFALGKLRGHTFEVAGAGMPPALVHRAASGRIEAVPLKGMPLGGPLAYPYRSERIELTPGDTVLLMSDGFPELQNPSGEMIGYDGVEAVFEAVAGASPEAVVRHFERTAQDWRGEAPLNDDMTFVVLALRDDDETKQAA